MSAQPAAADDATAFGARETINSAALSADGKKLVYVGAGTEASTIAVVVDLVTGTAAAGCARTATRSTSRAANGPPRTGWFASFTDSSGFRV